MKVEKSMEEFVLYEGPYSVVLRIEYENKNVYGKIIPGEGKASCPECRAAIDTFLFKNSSPKTMESLGKLIEECGRILERKKAEYLEDNGKEKPKDITPVISVGDDQIRVGEHIETVECECCDRMNVKKITEDTVVWGCSNCQCDDIHTDFYGNAKEHHTDYDENTTCERCGQHMAKVGSEDGIDYWRCGECGKLEKVVSGVVTSLN